MKNFTKIYGTLIILISFTFSPPLIAQEGPHRLSEFSVTRMENQVAIDWKVDQETPFSVYEVQRAHNGHHFETIERIHGKDVDLSLTSFEIFDKNPPIGKVQYRIKGFSERTKPQVFESLSLDLEDTGNQMEISHLVANKQGIHFHLLNPHSATLEIQIRSLSGQLIAVKKEVSGKKEIDISFPLTALASGMYIVDVRNVQGEIIREKFLY